MSDLGGRIKQAVNQCGKTQRQVANEIGITEVAMSRYIHDNRIPKAPIASEIAKTCGVSVEWLMTGKKQPSKHIEMIIDYVTDGTDYQYNDNKGILTRCKDCEYLDRLMCKLRLESVAWHDFCSKAVRKDDGNS